MTYVLYPNFNPDLRWYVNLNTQWVRPRDMRPLSVQPSKGASLGFVIASLDQRFRVDQD